MIMSIFKKIMPFVCLITFMVVLSACNNNQTSDIVTVIEPTEVVVYEPILELHIVQQVVEPESVIEETDEEQATAILTVDEALILASHELPFEGQADVVQIESTWENGVEIYRFEVIWFGDAPNFHRIVANSITGIIAIEEIWYEWDDWYDDYDPYWMYRISGADPFESGSELDLLAMGYLSMFQELDIRLGMTLNEVREWLNIHVRTNNADGYSYSVTPRGRFGNPTLMFEGLEFFMELEFIRGSPVLANENDILRYKIVARAWYQQVTDQEIMNVVFRFVEMFGEPHYITNHAIAWESNGNYLNVSDSTNIIIKLSSEAPSWVRMQRRN